MLFKVGEFARFLNLHLLSFIFLLMVLLGVKVLVSRVLLHVKHILLLVLTGLAGGLVGLLESGNGGRRLAGVLHVGDHRNRDHVLCRHRRHGGS